MVSGGARVKGILRYGQKSQDQPFKQSLTSVSKEWNKLQMGNGSGSSNGVKWQDGVAGIEENGAQPPLANTGKRGNPKMNSDMVQHSELDKSERLSDD